MQSPQTGWMPDFATANEKLLAEINFLVPGGEWRNGEYWAPSPLRPNSDSADSFHVYRKNEKWHFKDFVSDEGGDLVDLAAKIRGMTAAEAARELTGASATTSTPKSAMHKTVEYQYFNADGSPWATIERSEDGHGGKSFCPVQPNGTRKLPEGPRPLYGLPELTEHPDWNILIVEGEKCVDSANAYFRINNFSAIAVTSCGGSNAAPKTNWALLKGRSVFLWPDRDTAGRKYIATVSEIVQGLQCSIRIITPPTGPDDGLDIADMLEAGRDTEIRALIAGAKTESDIIAEKVGIQSLADIQAVDTPRVWFWDEIATFGIFLVAAKKGLYKSWLLLQLAYHIAAGIPFLGRCVRKTNVLICALELDTQAMSERARKLGVYSGVIDVLFSIPRGIESLKILEALILSRNYGFVVVDMLPALLPIGTDGNNYDEITPFMLALRRLGQKHGVCFACLMHAGKSERDDYADSILGSTAFSGQADTLAILTRKRGENVMKFSSTGNHGRDAIFSIDIDENLQMSLKEETDEEKKGLTSDGIRALNALREYPDGSTIPVLSAVLGKTPDATRKQYDRLAATGLVLKIERGSYRAI